MLHRMLILLESRASRARNKSKKEALMDAARAGKLDRGSYDVPVDDVMAGTNRVVTVPNKSVWHAANRNFDYDASGKEKIPVSHEDKVRRVRAALNRQHKYIRR